MDKPAVLVVRLAKNHQLPDGKTRAARVAVRLFVELNSWSWRVTPSVDESSERTLAVASGEWSHELMADWLRQHLTAPETP